MKNNLKFSLWICLILLCASISIQCSSGKDTDVKHAHEDAEHEEHAGEHKEHESEAEHEEHAGEHEENETEAEHAEHADEKKAVVKSDKQKGIILLPEAVKNIGIVSVPVKRLSSGNKSFQVPQTSLIYYEDKVCVLYKHGDWYSKTDVKIFSKRKAYALVHTAEISSRDSIVIKGAALLYLSLLEAFGASGHGHMH